MLDHPDFDCSRLLSYHCSSNSPGSSCQDLSFHISFLVLRTYQVGPSTHHRNIQGGVTSSLCRCRRPPPPPLKAIIVIVFIKLISDPLLTRILTRVEKSKLYFALRQGSKITKLEEKNISSKRLLNQYLGEKVLHINELLDTC